MVPGQQETLTQRELFISLFLFLINNPQASWDSSSLAKISLQAPSPRPRDWVAVHSAWRDGAIYNVVYYISYCVTRSLMIYKLVSMFC